MESKLDSKVNAIVQDLIVISQLAEYDKLRITEGSLQIQPYSWMQRFKRMLGGDKREQTKQHIEDLYDDACYVSDVLMKLVDLNIVLVTNKQQLTALENKVYWAHRQALDLLVEWLSKSLPKLSLLHGTTYGGTETVFVMIERRASQKLEEIRSHCAKLTEAYAKMTILSPLAAGFSVNTSNSNGNSETSFTTATASTSSSSAPAPAPPLTSTPTTQAPSAHRAHDRERERERERKTSVM
jgi:hypothetical protein